VQVKGDAVFVELPAAAGAGASPAARKEALTRRAPRACAPAAAAGEGAHHVVIIGGGAAGYAAAEALRGGGFSGAVTIVSREAAPPYDRTRLSKNMGYELADIALRPPAWYEAQRITLRLGARVVGVDTGARRVALEGGGAPLAYDSLICATGGPARSFRADRAGEGETALTPGAELPGVLTLRALPDSAAAHAAGGAAARAGAPIAVVGTSFIGMETASYLVAALGAARGTVHVVGMEAVPFERVLGRAVGGFLRALFEARGVVFHCNAVVTRFTAGRNGRVSGVELARAPGAPPGAPPPPPHLPAALVIIGAGIIPAVDYLKGAAGVTLRAGAPGGVEVDACLRAAPGVWAAGDIAFFPTPSGGARIEHYDVACDQGRRAGENALAALRGGAQRPYDGVPFFWTAAFGTPLRYAGRASNAGACVVQGEMDPAAPERARFVAFYGGAAGDVEAVLTFNEGAAPLAAAAQTLLRARRMPPLSAFQPGPAISDLAALLAPAAPAEEGGGGGRVSPSGRRGSGKLAAL